MNRTKITPAENDGMNVAWMVDLQPGDGTRYTFFVWDFLPVTGKQEFGIGSDIMAIQRLDRVQILDFIENNPDIMAAPGDYQRMCFPLIDRALVQAMALFARSDKWAALAAIRAIAEIKAEGLLLEETRVYPEE